MIGGINHPMLEDRSMGYCHSAVKNVDIKEVIISRAENSKQVPGYRIKTGNRL
jgi:hypothetical protein